ncbi:bifunctional biotin--[acetyl-CoA-carboxylase] ligase/biotin operon repressor BirA [Stutzerimonas zhaodongensis]|uniref:Bifunctional ligase/repressor BirA n=1 Tax=Stutzerimonas zhaodongensis TaxID=1176257 RepID=A0A365PN90_9GAMM|nr:bifunctional biotin--[acetyl-CoA-carboxylase] ligase/biotin operon repressor BirA [Stutzerimonas zhaodongensis]QWV19176.1 bifunctional biotin--[acetyl-CoA-carboxylase] ligase/biotin operon repressor BirA [Stutzerimonas zhaodongensis]RBA50810.1 bifunctional biotin--[acetyl-CoA-carboxylase] synthetase/biotin operon repressor [Stutzerimonas zhaodongensis]
MNSLLRLLGDGRFHSGEELGRALGVSRSAVWKYLQGLEDECGIELFKVPGKGYRLAEPLSLLNYEDNAAVLAPLGWQLYLRESTDSTNAEALRLLQSGVAAPFVVLAEGQTHGRGRRGRVWTSPPAQNIYYTLVLKVSNGLQGLSGLSLVVGLAVLRALHRAGIESAGLKWPNDVYAGGRKIAGILLELNGDPADVCHVIIGIGVNVNMAPSTQGIGQAWTSVREQTGMLASRDDLVRFVSEALSHYLERHAREGFSSLRDEWEAHNIWRGRRCTLSTGTQQVKGLMKGLDEQGALRLWIEGQGERCFSGGELSLRLDDDS